MERARLGIYGEELVSRHLAANGCRVLERNWRCPFGEIDLVVLERDEVVFVEVKTRHNDRFGQPEDAVTHAKRVKLRRCAYAYLAARGWAARRFRIDIYAVTLGVQGSMPRVVRFRGAVGERD